MVEGLKQKSINGVIWNLTEKFGIQFIKLILGVILARLLLPEHYGLIGMITVFIAISTIFIDSGFGLAYIQKQDASKKDASTIFYFNLIVSSVFYALLWLSAPYIAKFYGHDELTLITRVVSLVLILNSFGMIQLAKLKKDVNFKKKTIILLLSTLTSSLLGIFAALNNYGVWSLVIQLLSKAFITSTGLWIFYNWRPKLYFGLDSLKSMLSFSSWALLMGVINAIFKNINTIVIGKFFPAAQLGFFTKATQFQQTISQTSAQAVGSVAFSIFSKIQDDKKALKNAARKFIQHTMFFVAPISMLFFVIAEPFFILLLTEKWSQMIPYFKLLLIAGVIFPLHMVNIQALIAQGKMKLTFNLSMIKNSLRVLNIIIMYRFGVIYIIYGEIFFSFISLIINTYYTKKLLNYGILEQVKNISSIIFTSFVLAAFGNMLIEIIPNDFLKIFSMVIVLTLLYVISIYYFNKPLLLSNINIIKEKLQRRKSIN